MGSGPGLLLGAKACAPVLVRETCNTKPERVSQEGFFPEPIDAVLPFKHINNL